MMGATVQSSLGLKINKRFVLVRDTGGVGRVPCHDRRLGRGAFFSCRSRGLEVGSRMG